jgi:hypothetical protein
MTQPPDERDPGMPDAPGEPPAPPPSPETPTQAWDPAPTPAVPDELTPDPAPTTGWGAPPAPTSQPGPAAGWGAPPASTGAAPAPVPNVLTSADPANPDPAAPGAAAPDAAAPGGPTGWVPQPASGSNRLLTACLIIAIVLIGLFVVSIVGLIFLGGQVGTILSNLGESV